MVKKNHHVLPASYLRNFSSSGLVRVWDKQRGTFRAQRPEKVSIRRFFYLTEEELEDAGLRTEQQVEDFLAKIEDDAAQALPRIVMPGQAERRDKSAVSWLVATLMFRTPDALDFSEQSIKEHMTSLLGKRARGEDDYSGEFTTQMAEQALEMFDRGEADWEVSKNMLLDRMNKSIKTASRILYDSQWTILSAPKGCSFVTGDIAHIFRGRAQNIEGPIGPSTFQIACALTSQHLLHTDGDGGGISFAAASPEYVRRINQAVAFASQEYVLSSSMQLLKSLDRFLRRNPDPPGVVRPSQNE